MIKLILIRHAITDANETGVFSGHGEAKLSEEGKAQVKKLQDFLSKERIHSLYASPSKRCIETIRGLAEARGLSIYIEEELKEISFGTFENKTSEEIQKDYPEEIEKMLREGNAYTYPEGESLIDSYRRHIKGLERILEKAENQTILICAHAGTIRNILSYFMVQDYYCHWKFKIDNASVTIVRITDNFPVIEALNERNFLFL